MSGLSGYDSEAVGFESVARGRRSEADGATQTAFASSGVGCQTSVSTDCGCTATPEDLDANEAMLKEYPPPGLNDFLRKVVPAMLEQLDQTNKDFLCDSSDSDEEDVIVAKLVQEIDVVESGVGSGDHEMPEVLALSWSSAGNSLAVSVGQTQHENWCEHDGLIRVYTVRRTQGDSLVHSLDISEKNCVTAVKYHPSLAALLAYGTSSGEVVFCNLCNLESGGFDPGSQLASPSGCHGSRRVSALKWADATLANLFLVMQISMTGKRRGASDQILISAGSDGTINVWQANASLKIFQNVVCYSLNGSRKMAAPDITCFDFIKSYPLRPSDEKIPDDIFAVGTKSGALYLCKISKQNIDGSTVDPVCEVLDGHAACVLDISFNFQKPGVFASMSADSELRIYDVRQPGPLKVVCLDMGVSCVSWLPNNPAVAVVGAREAAAAGGAASVRVLSAWSGRALPVRGLDAAAPLTALALNQSGTCRVAAGGAGLRVWELPARRIRMAPEDLDF